MSTTFYPFEIEPSWRKQLENEFKLPYLIELAAFVEREYTSGASIYPPKDLIFNAFWQTPYNNVKVLIMGQDPYHGPHQAHGLSFSVPTGIALPPSLQNIYKELAADLGIPTSQHGCLLHWAQQGVLLLNATLTVKQGEPMSHHGRGWERFTDAVIEVLCNRSDPIIFVLWGKSAQEKCKRIKYLKNSNHIVLTAPHPSPLSAHNGFFGCRHFSQVNEHLLKKGKTPIEWKLNP
jgi:uracil-DNA glycosylase